MAKFATSLNQQIALDLKQVRSTLEELDNALPANLASPADRDRTDLLTRLPLTTSARIPFDFVFWTNKNGCQVAKWTTRQFNTPRVDQADQDYFQNVLARKLWSIAGDAKTQFTLQTLVSRTTSELIVVMAMPSNHSGTQVKVCDTAPAPIVSAAIVAPLPSSMRRWYLRGSDSRSSIPPAACFFTSSPERNLHENLFEEIHSPAPFRARPWQCARNAPAGILPGAPISVPPAACHRPGRDSLDHCSVPGDKNRSRPWWDGCGARHWLCSWRCLRS